MPRTIHATDGKSSDAILRSLESPDVVLVLLLHISAGRQRSKENSRFIRIENVLRTVLPQEIRQLFSEELLFGRDVGFRSLIRYLGKGDAIPRLPPRKLSIGGFEVQMTYLLRNGLGFRADESPV